MAGIFELKTAKDLYEKLKRDFSAFEKDPLNSDLAFNFFVTGWHLLEWACPGNDSIQKQIRESSIVLQICEHLAVGAKHFEPTNKKHKSVKRSDISGGVWKKGVWAKGVWKKGIWGEKLEVLLDGEAAQQFGEKIYAIDLAKEVLAYWKESEQKFTKPGASAYSSPRCGSSRLRFNVGLMRGGIDARNERSYSDSTGEARRGCKLAA